MNPSELLTLCQKQGIKLELKDSQLVARGKLNSDLKEMLKANRDPLRFHLLSQQTIPRLPWQLERLVMAASHNLLTFSIKGVINQNHYVMAWACAYLAGDRQEALKRLWAVQALREVN